MQVWFAGLCVHIEQWTALRDLCDCRVCDLYILRTRYLLFSVVVASDYAFFDIHPIQAIAILLPYTPVAEVLVSGPYEIFQTRYLAAV